MPTTAAADAFFRKLPRWKEEFAALRAIIRPFPLEEGFKWRWPCYMLEGRNVVLIHGFKAHCAVLFFQGARIAHPHGLLVKPGDQTQRGRQMRFHSLQEIQAREAALTAAIAAAIAVEREGAPLVQAERPALVLPAELQAAFRTDAGLRKAFAALTPGRQRSWVLHIGSAKQVATRQTRIARAAAAIHAGKGFNEA